MSFPDPQLETITVVSQRYMNNSRLMALLLLAQQYDPMRTLHLKMFFHFYIYLVFFGQAIVQPSFLWEKLYH